MKEEEEKLQGVSILFLDPGQAQPYREPGFPYMATALAQVRRFVIWSDDLETAGLDKYWRLYINPEFWMKSSPQECVGILAHELMHGIGKDHERRENREAKKWNVAADLAINDCKKLHKKLPQDCLHPSQFGFPTGLTAEQYYEMLPDGGPCDKPGDTPGGGGRGGGSISDGEKRPWELPPPDKGGPPGLGKAEQKVLERRIAEAILSSSTAQGDLPGHMVAALREALKPPKVRWQQVLRARLKDAEVWVRGNSDYSYSTISWRQSMAQERVVFPGMVSPVPDICCVVDTSGSMSDRDLEDVLSEIDGIIAAIPGSEPRAIPCDTQIGEIQTVRRASDIKLHGRGGTDMTVGIKAALTLKPRPNIILTMTDGYTGWPDAPTPGVHQIAVIMGKRKTSSGIPDWMTKVIVD